MEPVRQEDGLGCAVACVAFILQIPYQQALTLFSDGKRRVKEHLEGKCHTTLRMHEPQIFCEGFILESEARRREGYFKTTKGKKTLRFMLRESLQL